MRSITADFADNFDADTGTSGAQVNYGTDGAGSVAYKLELSSASVGSGLFALDATKTDGKGAEISLSKTSDTVISGKVGTTEYFTISVNASSGEVTFAHTVTNNTINNIWHADTSTTNRYDDASVLNTTASGDLKLTQTVTDRDRDTSTASIDLGRGVFKIEDDGPSLAFGNLVGTGTTLAQYGSYSKAPGTDGPNAADLQIALTGFSLGGVTQATGNFSLTELSPSPDGSGNYKWDGSLKADFDNDGTVDATPLAFSLMAQPDGKYTLKLATPVQSEIITDTADGALGAGGPDPVQTLFIPPAPAIPKETVVFFSAKIDSSAGDIASGIIKGVTDPTEASLQGPPLAGFIDPRSMNVSTAGIGVDNNLLNGYGASGANAIIDDPAGNDPSDDSFVVNPGTLVDKVRVFVDNSVTGYDYAGGERMQYRVFYADGDVSEYITVTSDLGKGTAPKFFEIDGAGEKIDAVQLTMLYGQIKVPNIQFVTLTQSLAKDISLDFTATLTDKDGDSATSNFSADIFANELNTATFDYELVGASPGRDSFNVDLASDLDTYKITGFDMTAGARDQIVLLGKAGASVTSINNGGPDSIVTIAEGGLNPPTTTLTVVGVDSLATDFLIV